MCICMYVCIYIYIYIYRERERDREREREREIDAGSSGTAASGTTCVSAPHTGGRSQGFFSVFNFVFVFCGVDFLVLLLIVSCTFELISWLTSACVHIYIYIIKKVVHHIIDGFRRVRRACSVSGFGPSSAVITSAF